MKIRRIIADFIDFTIIYVLLFGQYNLVIECLEKNNLYESIIYILFIILGVFILCSKEILFKGRTLGKKITKLYVVDCYNNIEYDVKRLFLRNLLTLITLPISIICIIIYNRTVGDFLLKSKVVCFNQNSILDKSKINNKFVLFRAEN